MKPAETKINQELNKHFDCARKLKCPESMQQNLYEKLQIDRNHNWFSPRFAIAGLSLVFVSSVIFNISSNHIQQQKLHQAQEELQIAMQYMNRVSFKSLSAVNNKGIKPGLIMPLTRTAALL
jgi:hypothetical protein